MIIDNKAVVSIHYTLTDDQGTQIDSSAGQEPLAYLHGAGNIIPGLENALTGKSEGDSLQVVVQPEEGYGLVTDALIQTVPREAFEADDITPGMQFQAQDDQGHVQQIVVREVSDEGVTIDGNHPLAGKVLYFDIEITEVREATPEELDHGHVHHEGHSH
ncbi:MAG: peptidylprolyl isomerase [Gammaproteobacteria bacterium]|nr:peptidylprolyl isomerase [Gammaproteobacteria bacterium]